MNEREIFAAVLLAMVRERCKAGTNGVLRTTVQASVPVNERAYVRRGLSALVDHGALIMNGEMLRLSPAGHRYLDQNTDYVYKIDTGPSAVEADLLLGNAIRADSRLSHVDIEAAITLPGRLEGRALPKPQRMQSMRRLLLVLALSVLVYVCALLLKESPSSGSHGAISPSEVSTPGTTRPSN